MELSAIAHIEPDKLIDFEADLFITTLGFESRCTSIARRLEGKSCRKLALSQPDHHRVFSFEKNQNYFQNHGFEILPVSTDVPDIASILKEVQGEQLNIIFDCTSMSQRWYYEFFRWFSDNQDDYSNVNLRFTYTMAGYVEPGHARKIRRIQDFLRVEDASRKKKKKALILGLGHERNVSEDIFRMVKPDLLYLLYADPPADKQFVEKVFVNNHALIETTSIRNLIAYPISNGQMIYQSLIDIILPIRDDYCIVLIPEGPKIFSVASMLIHLGYPDTIISYPVFRKSQVLDRKPTGDPVILDVHFEGEE
jgi:hypothetical protein